MKHENFVNLSSEIALLQLRNEKVEVFYPHAVTHELIGLSSVSFRRTWEQVSA